MKKFGMMMLALSLFGFTVGCGGAEDAKDAAKDAVDSTADAATDAIDSAADAVTGDDEGSDDAAE